MLIWWAFPSHTAINLSYALTGAAFFIPLLIFLSRTQWRGVRSIGSALFWLLLSLLFRQLDQPATALLPMGSHFLWHLFSGLGAYYLGAYLYRLGSPAAR
ncbi:hypothetical protein [Cesiribacter andamanensis]|nr:hypothetical protein [Cesiribacter andamanensis]